MALLREYPRMNKDDLLAYAGKKVRIEFKCEEILEGKLGYTYEWSDEFDWRPVGYFYIGHKYFRCSHVSNVEEIE